MSIAENRRARRAWVGARLAEMDPRLFPLLFGAFAGPESVPEELFDDRLFDDIRAA